MTDRRQSRPSDDQHQQPAPEARAVSLTPAGDRRADGEFVDRRKGGSGGPPPGTTVDRRVWPVDRRNVKVAGRPDLSAPEARAEKADEASGLERRRGPGRRLSDYTKAAEEGEMTQEQFLFLMAIEAFKKANGRPFPTWTDVLEVVRLLGYRKTMPMELTLRNAEDWNEAADAPSSVRPDRWHERAA